MAEKITPSDHATDAPVTRLPPYFPTTCVDCNKPTELFFACFEEHAIMDTPTDTLSAKRALLYCQQELKAYMNCMENYLDSNNQDKKWWKIW